MYYLFGSDESITIQCWATLSCQYILYSWSMMNFPSIIETRPPQKKLLASSRPNFFSLASRTIAVAEVVGSKTYRFDDRERSTYL